MRYVGELIRHLRSRTGRRTATSTSGLPTEDFLQYLNDAQFELQDAILAANPDVTLWDERYEQDIVGSQQGYDIPEYFSWRSSLRSVEFSRNGDAKYYLPLDLVAGPHDLCEDTATYPDDYCILGQKVLLGPIPTASGGKLRFNGPRRVDRLDVRRGKISTVNDDSTNYTSLVLDSSADDTEGATAQVLGATNYITVTSLNGTVERYAIPVASYNDSTNTITLASGVAIADGTITANNYVVAGRYGNTHPHRWPEECERFLLSWCAWKLRASDENVSLADEQAELDRHVQAILGRINTLNLGVELLG